MNIRHAHKEDAAVIAQCLLYAMDTIVYRFIGLDDWNEALRFLTYFVSKENNQYSYENCFVAIEEDSIVGAINVYDGGLLDELRKPIASYIESKYNRPFQVENETEKGEWYIDTIGVLPSVRGKGVGTALLNYVITTYSEKAKNTIGLLVEEDNHKARKLYASLGFVKIGNKTLVGKHLEHMQLSIVLAQNTYF